MDDHAPVLSVSEVVFRQVGACDKHIIVEDVGLDVMDTENLSHCRLAHSALQQPRVRHVKEADSDFFTPSFSFEPLEHAKRALPVSRDSGATHVIKQHRDSDVGVGPGALRKLFDQVLLQISSAQVQRAHTDPFFSIIG